MSRTGTDLPPFIVPFLRRIPGTLSSLLNVAVAGKFQQDHGSYQETSISGIVIT
jgi:hypothetical protein